MEHNKTVKVINQAGPTGFVYLMAYIGAAVYFIEQNTSTFGGIVLGLLQAIAWPAYIVYQLLRQLVGA